MTIKLRRRECSIIEITNTGRKSKFFNELTLNLRQEGFTAGPEVDGLLPVELDGQRLCQITGSGGVRYWKEDVTSGTLEAALEQVTGIANVTAEYMNRMESASQLKANGLTGDYRLLAEFNSVVLAGHPTQYGVQFISWEQSTDQTSLTHGHYYGPGVGADGYTAAKQDFAVRSGLIPRNALFTPEQLAEMYRCVHETLGSGYPITGGRQKCLESAAAQIEAAVPDLDERVALSNDKELEFADRKFAQDSGMQFC